MSTGEAGVPWGRQFSVPDRKPRLHGSCRIHAGLPPPEPGCVQCLAQRAAWARRPLPQLLPTPTPPSGENDPSYLCGCSFSLLRR